MARIGAHFSTAIVSGQYPRGKGTVIVDEGSADKVVGQTRIHEVEAERTNDQDKENA
jgi:hypothetical protein